jgi:hypothetical protein
MRFHWRYDIKITGHDFASAMSDTALRYFAVAFSPIFI